MQQLRLLRYRLLHDHGGSDWRFLLRVEGSGFWTVCFERVVMSSPGCLWPGRMNDHEDVLEAHA